MLFLRDDLTTPVSLTCSSIVPAQLDWTAFPYSTCQGLFSPHWVCVIYVPQRKQTGTALHYIHRKLLPTSAQNKKNGQCIACSGYFLCCSYPSHWTQRCGSTTPCSWASTCSASYWKESPAPSVPWSFWLPFSSFAIVAGTTAFSTIARMLRCQMQHMTQL